MRMTGIAVPLATMFATLISLTRLPAHVSYMRLQDRSLGKRRRLQMFVASAIRLQASALVIIGILILFASPDSSQSLISSRATKAPDFAPARAAVSPTMPTTPSRAELPPPPMKIVPGLTEVLVATGPVTDQESKDLDLALKAFHEAPLEASPGSDFSDYAQPLLAFVEAHPRSNWNAALYLNLGLGYYHAGYYSRAITDYEKAWSLGKNAPSFQAHLMIDRAVGELAEMHARLGHAKEIEAVLADIGKRPIGGPATELLQGAREGLATFYHRPEIAYLCGPYALRNLLISLHADARQIKIAEDAHSGPHGFSLQQLAELADRSGFRYTLVYRKPGQPIPVPSVINWNVHHYAAIIGQEQGQYLVQDPTFGNIAAAPLTAKAIDAESSGYFLVPAEGAATGIAESWRAVAAESAEAKAVYGMGTAYYSPWGMTTVSDAKNCTRCSLNNMAPQPQPESGKPGGMAIASAHIMSVSLNLTDTPVGYQPQKGGSALTTLSYNSREAEQPANFSFSNVGPKWTHSWISYVQDDPNNPGSSVTRIMSGGGGFDYTLVVAPNSQPIYNKSTGAFVPETYDNSLLVRNPPSGPATSYQRNMPDGSTEIYGLSNGATTSPRLMFLTQLIDPAGNTTTLNYDATFRITSVTDAMGRNTLFSYDLEGYPLLITEITDPFGRTSQLSYTAGQLTGIKDPIGIKSTFTYGSATDSTFITQLATPYGTSKFSETLNPNDPQPYSYARSLAMTDPLGYVDYLYFYQDDAVTHTPSEAVIPPALTMGTDNGLFQWRNTYYWNRHASALGVTTDANGNPTAENFAYPTIHHFLHLYQNTPYVTNQLGYLKKPLEANQVYYNYPGMSVNFYYYSGTLMKPIRIDRVLDNGSPQLTQATYNSVGLPLTAIDPLNRTTTYTYASNNIDLLTVQQLTAPSTYTTIATFADYNDQHQPQTYTGADGQTWHYSYNAAGQLQSVTDPDSGVTTYNYDALGRLSNVINANNATALTLTYDSADRIQTRTDSEGYTLTYAYDNLDRITKITYPDNTTDLYSYNFQSGAHAGTPSLELRKHTDRLGRATTYNYDADQRLISVTEPISATATRTTNYDYYEDGTLKDIIDANGNDTHWDIDAQSRPIDKVYAYGTASAQTETYAYEKTISRLHSITDALGQVKTFTYATDDRITGITYTSTVNPTPNVTFTWDPYFPRLSSMVDGIGTTNYSYTPIGTNGALKLSSVAGPFTSIPANDTMSLTYDALGRLSGRNIVGGNETFGYDLISRLNSHDTPLGSFTYGYLGQTDQTTSRGVTNGATSVSTSWAYDTNVNDRRLISITNSGVSRSYALSYLLSGTTQDPYDIKSITDMAAPGHPWATQSHAYGYDRIDRLLSATATTPGDFSYAYDDLDNATTVTKPGSTVKPTYNALNQIKTWGAKTYTYDADGNLLSGDGTHTYRWDAENRLIEIDYVGSSAKSNFSYDGLGHRLQDVETAATGGTTTTRYQWCGSAICQTRDGSDNVQRRDLDEGEYNVSTGRKLLYMPDQLGSVRDVLDGSTGVLVHSYDYTPYGAIARSNGITPTDYRYGGLFYHAASALNLSATRPMDGNTGRWLNRDPLKESAGINLYAYVRANTINFNDTNGLGSEYSCINHGLPPEDCEPPPPVNEQGPGFVIGGGVCAGVCLGFTFNQAGYGYFDSGIGWPGPTVTLKYVSNMWAFCNGWTTQGGYALSYGQNSDSSGYGFQWPPGGLSETYGMPLSEIPAPVPKAGRPQWYR